MVQILPPASPVLSFLFDGGNHATRYHGTELSVVSSLHARVQKQGNDRTETNTELFVRIATYKKPLDIALCERFDYLAIGSNVGDS